MIFTKSFGPLIFVCRLPKETSLSIWGTFTMFPIPPSSTTLVTEFFEERGKMDFPHFLVFLFGQMVPYAFKSSSVTKTNNMVCMELLWCVPIYVHWCYIGDRKSLYWKKGPKVPKCA